MVVIREGNVLDALIGKRGRRIGYLPETIEVTSDRLQLPILQTGTDQEILFLMGEYGLVIVGVRIGDLMNPNSYPEVFVGFGLDKDRLEDVATALMRRLGDNFVKEIDFDLPPTEVRIR